MHFRHQPVVRHIFVLTLGFSRRSFYHACAAETLPLFLDAHERAFEHFGGHTREHLYDRPRTVCHGGVGATVVWNPTFKAFAAYWSFEPRVCRPYRAQTKLGGPGLEEEFLRTARPVDLGGVTVPVIGPEELLVTKVLAGRPKDLDDVRGILAAQGDTLDLPRVRGLLRALEAAIDRSDLLPALEEQLQAVRTGR